MSRRIRRRSQRQEKEAASDLGGRTVAGSGAAKFSGGGDVRRQGEVRVECKYTTKTYFDLKLGTMKKIKLQALKGGLEQPVLQLEFLSGVTSVKYAVVPALEDSDLHHEFTTTKKQIRMYRDWLVSLLAQHGEGFQVTFLEGVRSRRPHTFTITHWSSWLRGLEEEE
jgi:hypothetical protein